MLSDQLKTPFTRDQTQRICDLVGRSAIESMQALEGRNDDFQTWDYQADGDPFWAGIPPRWEGGCDTEDPMTDEQRFEIVAAMLYILASQEWLQVETTGENDEDEQGAANIQAFLNDVFVEAEITTKHAYDLMDLATRHSYGVLVCEWQQKIEYQYEFAWQHKQTERTEPEGSQKVLENPDAYDLIEQRSEALISDGITCRVPYTGDVYLDPPTAQSFEEAERIIERFEYTSTDLLNGIRDYGFDKSKVADILRMGPGGLDTGDNYASDRDSIDGIARTTGTTDTSNKFEVLQVLGTPPPLLRDGVSEIREPDRRRDYQWMIFPAGNVCFKFRPSAYKKRPYVKYPFRGRAGRMIGYSVCSMLCAMQQEATIAFRFAIDFRDLYFSSPLLAPDTWAVEFERWNNFPGAILPYPTTPPMNAAQAIMPLPVNPAGFTASMTNLQDTRERANQIFSADARGPGASLQRTATEANQAAAGADEKLDLLLFNFKLGISDTAEVILSHYQQFAGSEPLSRRVGAKVVEITPEMLKKQYRIMAVGTSENASPQIKLQRATLLRDTALADPMLQQRAQQGDMSAYYEVFRRLYVACGVRNPQAIQGREPTPGMDPQMLVQVLMAKAMQYAQAGDPGCQDLVMTAQQLMQSQAGQMPPQAGAAQGQGGAQLDVTAKLLGQLAPNQQQAVLEKSGVPPPEQQGQQGQQGPMGIPGGGGPMPMVPQGGMVPQMNGFGGY